MKQSIILFLSCVMTVAAMAQGNAKKLTKAEVMADYDYFFEQLVSVHPDPYTDMGGKEAFEAKVSKLRNDLSQADNLEIEEVQRRVMQLISPLHDGHTYMGWVSAPHIDEDKYMPVNFRQINDGIIVVKAMAEMKELLGGRLMAVDGVAMETLYERANGIVMSENHNGVVENTISFLRNNNRLSMLGIKVSDDKVDLSLKLADDRDTIVAMPLYAEEYFQQKHEFVAPNQDERLPRRNLQYAIVDGKMFFRLSSVVSKDNIVVEKQMGMDFERELKYAWREYTDREMPADVDLAIAELPSIASQVADMLRKMKEQNVKTLVVDLRGNGGGWTPILYATMYEMFGDEYIMKDLGITYGSKISPLYLAKNGMTLEQLNAGGGSYKMGDYIYSSVGKGYDEMNDSIRQNELGGYMCADRRDIEAQKGSAIYTPEKIYVLTDAQTFSAAFHYAFMLWKMGATIVGVPSGQAPNTFMEVTQFNLPNSGMQCSVSNAIQIFLPADHKCAKTLWPQIMPTYDDYRKNGFDSDTEIKMINEY